MSNNVLDYSMGVLGSVRGVSIPLRMNYFLTTMKNTSLDYTGAGCYGNLIGSNNKYRSGIGYVVDYPFLARDLELLNINQSFNFLNEKFNFREVYFDWINWVVNNSNWSNVFITKDVDKILERGILYDITLDNRSFFQAAATIREPLYHPTTLQVWDYLRKNTKLSPNELYIASQKLSVTGETFSIISGEFGVGHQGFYINTLSNEAMNNFLINNKINIAAHPNDIGWSPSAGLWGQLIGNIREKGEIFPESKNNAKLFSNRSNLCRYPLSEAEKIFREYLKLNWKV